VPFGGGRSLSARVRADRLERDACSGRRYYSHLVVTTGAHTQRVWVAPGCEFTRHQRTFRGAVRTRLARLPGRVVFVNDARCTFDSPGIWSCTATGDREYTESPGVIRTCIYAARGHFTGSRVVLAPLRCRRLV